MELISGLDQLGMMSQSMLGGSIFTWTCWMGSDNGIRATRIGLVIFGWSECE